MSSCFHCGLPNPAAARYHALVLGEPRAFCCPGCVAVAESIVASGLSSYYQERDSASPTAALPEALEDLLRYDHPAAQSDFVHREGRYACTELSLENVSCAACAWLIERRLSQEGSVAQASVNLSNHRLRLVWDDSQRPLSSLLTALESIGYRARPFRADTHAAQLKSEARTQLIRVALAGLGTMQAMMYGLGLYIGAFQGISDEYRDYLRWISGLVATPVFFYAGWPFYRAAVNALKARSLTMDVPVSIALIFAYTASWFATVTHGGETYFDSVCMFIFFLQTSRYLELKARQHAGETAASLMTLDTLEAAAGQGIRRVDFGPGEEAYKRIWATDFIRTESYMGALNWRGSVYMKLSMSKRTELGASPVIWRLYGALPRAWPSQGAKPDAVIRPGASCGRARP